MDYPSYNPALGRAKLAEGGEGDICNQNVALNSVARIALISKARRRFHAAERNTMMFAADLRRLHDAGVHRTGTGSKDFALWASNAFHGLSKANAKQLCWQGGALLILEGHGLLDISAVKLRLGATAVRKLASVLGHFDEDTLLRVWHQATLDKPDGKIIEDDVSEAMKNTGTFILNRQQQEEEEERDEIIVPLNTHADREDFADAPASRAPNANRPNIEAIIHLHQELVDPFDKLRRDLVKLTDPDNQPYDIAKIQEQFNEAVGLLLDLGDLIDDSLFEDHDAA